MFSRDQYELVDFGDGRKLERFGAFLLDRPCAAAVDPPAHPPAWTQASARYQRLKQDRGRWTPGSALPADWRVACSDLVFELRATEFGHLGLFAEQAGNWNWIDKQVRRAGRKLRVLNLFAYTGGSTLAAAAAGASVVHVDAARNTVAWARRNAELSGLGDAPIRWIVDDASKFVSRELRRGNRYDAVILDPPTYGHGPQQEAWKIGQQLLPLLAQCAELTSEQRAFILLTCHSPGYGPAELQASLADAIFGSCQSGATAKQLCLETQDGRRLHSGVVARWPEI